MKGDCTICKERDCEVIYLQLYTTGSEGTQVCTACGIALSEVAKRMIASCQRAYMSGYKQGREQR